MSSLFAVVLIVCSCNTSMNINTSDISLEFTNKEMESSSILNNQKFVRLESPNKSSIIKSVNRLLCSDSLLFIVDKTSNKIASFDYDGKFIASTLNLIGHAKDEYVHLRDAAIDERHKKLYVCCDIPSQVLIMDYGFHVENCIKMKDLFLEIALDSTYLYALCPDLSDESKYDIRYYSKYNLTDSPNILIQQDKAIPKVEGMGKALNRSGEHIFACMPFDNTIYEISEGNILNSWHIDFGDKWINYSKNRKLKARKFLSANDDKHWVIQNIASSGKIIIFNSNQTNTFKVSIPTSNGHSYLRFKNNSIPFSNSWFIPTSGIYNVAFSIPSAQIVDYLNYYTNRNESLPDNPINASIQSVSIEDNPLIVLGNIVR